MKNHLPPEALRSRVKRLYNNLYSMKLCKIILGLLDKDLDTEGR